MDYEDNEQAANPDSNIQASEARQALVKRLQGEVKRAKRHHKDAFRKMREDMEVAVTGTSKEVFRKNKKYVANVVQRHIAQRISALYAKNPKAIAHRRPRRDFTAWDGKVSSIQQAMATMTAAQQTGMVNPQVLQSMQVVQDYQQVMANRQMIDGVGDTLVQLFHYFLDEQTPNFKIQMKQVVRRAVTTGVGYVKIGFQREMDRTPEVNMRLEDVTMRLAHLERLQLEAASGDLDILQAEVEEARLMMQDLTNQQDYVVREGLVFGYPESTAVIVDPRCKHLRGFVGARWVAEEYIMSPDDVMENYGVEIKAKEYTVYNTKGDAQQTSGAIWKDTRDPDNPMVCVWEYYDKLTGLMYTIADGYRNFLEEPVSPNVSVERFFPFYTVMFNGVESDCEVYPPSDVRLLTPMQDEYNRAREGLREHRMAARPKYVTPHGALEDDDKTNLASMPAHKVLEVSGMQPGQNVADFIQAAPTMGIDPNLYITNHLMEDVQLVVGAQEAHFGGVAGATATETSVAESSRMSSLQSNVDDLDDFLSEVARDSGQVLLLEMSQDKVFEIVGPGAVWPQMTRDQIVKEITLKIEAGSSGRPNKAAELSNLERVLPYLLQMPGIDPMWLAKEVLRRLDDRLDLAEALPAQMIPSITAINGMQQVGTGDPTTSPEQQGPQGRNNAPQPEGNSGSQAPMGANNM